MISTPTGGGWNHLMSELTPEPDEAGGENKIKNMLICP
jgi:hypothetical protein